MRWTELRLWLGMLLLPPGLANHRFCRGRKGEIGGWARSPEGVSAQGSDAMGQSTLAPNGAPALIRASHGHHAPKHSLLHTTGPPKEKHRKSKASIPPVSSIPGPQTEATEQAVGRCGEAVARCKPTDHPSPRGSSPCASGQLTCRPWPPRLGLVRACREMPPRPEGLRRPILLGGRARGGNGNCRWVRRATPIPTEPAMGSELEPNAQLRKKRKGCWFG